VLCGRIDKFESTSRNKERRSIQPFFLQVKGFGDGSHGNTEVSASEMPSLMFDWTNLRHEMM